jgi:tetratricopeptide (TPR) repeat protein
MLRPFLDLGRFSEGPLYARGIEEYWRAFAQPETPVFSLQRTLPVGFRLQLVEEAGRPEYAVSDPRQLPKPLRTPRWQAVCDALGRWRSLPDELRLRLVMLLHSLCLYEPVLAHVPARSPERRAGPDAVELAYWRASARYVLGLPNRVADYRAADMSVFEAIAERRPDAVPAAFNAAVKVFVHSAKVGAPLDVLERRAARMARIHADTVARADDFTADLLTSRFYRALALLPQRRGRRAQAVRLMDLAERHARALRPATPAQDLMYLENLHPVMESRAKEALWLGDLELALARALEVTRLDPYDSKAWVELGQVHRARKEWALAAEAYVLASMLGPPASAIGRHMAALCFAELGQPALAAFLFKETLEVDPLGISPRDGIGKLPDLAVLHALKEWSRSTVKL